MKLLRNENGLSLAELLATLVVGSLIVVFIVSIHILIQKQYSSQSESAQQLTDVTIAVKAITKDIRSLDIDYKNRNSSTITFTNGTQYSLDENSNILKKNDVDYIYEIKNFNVDIDQNKKSVILKIESVSGKNIETEIIIR